MLYSPRTHSTTAPPLQAISEAYEVLSDGEITLAPVAG